MLACVSACVFCLGSNYWFCLFFGCPLLLLRL
jgi:hypothetical protein